MSYRRPRGTDPLTFRELLDMHLNKTKFERNSSLEYYFVSHDLFCENKKYELKWLIDFRAILSNSDFCSIWTFLFFSDKSLPR